MGRRVDSVSEEELLAAALSLSADSSPSRDRANDAAERDVGWGQADLGGAEESTGAGSDLDAEALFSDDLRLTSVLDRREEEQLARRIVRARNRVRRIARKAGPVWRAALAGFGRGLLTPEEGFREIEISAILSYARMAAARKGRRDETGMTREQLRDFASELSAALTDYRELRDRMVVANLRLVILFARRHRHPRLAFLDFVQEGTLGLIRAVEKYQPGRKVKFSTYAVYWIWQQIARAADTQGALIRTPVHWNQVRRRLNRDRVQPENGDGGPRSADEWAKEYGIGRERLERMARPLQCVSTDAPLSEDDDRSFEEQLAAGDPAPEEVLLRSDLQVRVRALVDRLPGREAEIMRRRFGLSDAESETLEAVGAHFGVSRERIRQIEGRALRHLRDLCAEAGLREYLS